MSPACADTNTLADFGSTAGDDALVSGAVFSATSGDFIDCGKTVGADFDTIEVGFEIALITFLCCLLYWS
jgi:hypothetical protein